MSAAVTEIDDHKSNSEPPVTRADLRHYSRDWRAYATRFGHLDLRKKRWEEMRTADLARFLRANGVTVERTRDGNKQLCLRLPDPLRQWVERNGAGEFVREKLEQLAFPELGAGAYGWERVRTVQGVRKLDGQVDQKCFVLWRRGRAWLYLPPEAEPQRLTAGYRTTYEAREHVAGQAGYVVQDAPVMKMSSDSEGKP